MKLLSACSCQAALKAHSVPVCLQGKTADTEPWYGTAYSCQPIPEEWLQQWKGVGAHDSGLHLPEDNHFIPSDLLMLEVSEPQWLGCLQPAAWGQEVPTTSGGLLSCQPHLQADIQQDIVLLQLQHMAAWLCLLSKPLPWTGACPSHLSAGL